MTYLTKNKMMDIILFHTNYLPKKLNNYTVLSIINMILELLQI